MRTSPDRRTWMVIFSVLVTIIILFYGYQSPWTSQVVRHGSNNPSIPNDVHFVYVLKEANADFSFQFKHYLSVYAAWHYWQPQTIYLHTNAHDDSITRARDGASGKWDKLIFGMPNLRINVVPVPSHANNSVEITGMEHKSDFVRVQAIRDFGGIYIDFDAHALRDIRPILKSGFNAVGGREISGQLNSGTFMSKKGAKMISLWHEEMHQVYDGGWITHSNLVLTRVGEQLVAEPGEMLILDKTALGPVGWSAEECSMLFEVHDDAPPETGRGNVEGQEFHDEGSGRPGGNPPWARDWSSTYILHAFQPDRHGYIIKGFDYNITPRYVLEGRSNFARAVYPVAKHMQENGLIELDDSHHGL